MKTAFSWLIGFFMFTATLLQAQSGDTLEMGRFEQIEVLDRLNIGQSLNLEDNATISGRVLFTDDIVGASNLSIDGYLKLKELAGHAGQIIVIDEEGRISSRAIEDVVSEVQTLDVNDLSVSGVASFAEAASFNNGVQFSAAATFLDAVDVAGMRVNSDLYLNYLDEEDAGKLLTIDTDGLVQGLSIDKLLNEIGGIGTPDNPCLTDGNGNPVSVTASWQAENNLLFTNRCTQNVRVGIGLSNPDETLDVNGNAEVVGRVYAGKKDPAFFSAHQFSGDINVGLLSENMSIGYDGAHSRIQVRSANPLVNNNMDLHINYGGGGIVLGGDPAAQYPSNLRVNNGDIYVSGLNRFSAVGDDAKLVLGDDNHNIRAERGLGISLSTFNAQDALVIREGSNRVGIGTVNPNAKFEVNAYDSGIPVMLATAGGQDVFQVTWEGRIFTRGINVTMNNFPDYVFDKKYTLKSLKEVEQYIEDNGRLPGMPSAKEVEENGANLEEINRLLVEKVEELTLHVIALSKEIENLKQQ